MNLPSILLMCLGFAIFALLFVRLINKTARDNGWHNPGTEPGILG